MSLKSGDYKGFVFSTGLQFTAIETALKTIRSDLSGSVVDLSGLQLEFQDLSSQVQALDLSAVLQVGNSAGASDIDMSNNDILQVNNVDVSSVSGIGGNLAFVAENLTFTGAGIQDVSAGTSSGQHLRINLNGTFYKLDLLDDT